MTACAVNLASYVDLVSFPFPIKQLRHLKPEASLQPILAKPLPKPEDQLNQCYGLPYTLFLRGPPFEDLIYYLYCPCPYTTLPSFISWFPKNLCLDQCFQIPDLCNIHIFIALSLKHLWPYMRLWHFLVKSILLCLVPLVLASLWRYYSGIVHAVGWFWSLTRQ